MHPYGDNYSYSHVIFVVFHASSGNKPIIHTQKYLTYSLI